MESWWMSKCDAALPAAAGFEEQRSQMENAGYLSCQRVSQDLRAGMLGRLQDPLLPGIQSSEHANLGNSFMSMPSGSLLPLQRGYQDFSNSHHIFTADRIVQAGSNSILNSSQGAVPVSSTGAPSDKFSWKNQQSGGSSKLVPSSLCASNYLLHDVQSSDLAKVVICHTGPDHEKPESSYAMRKEWHTGGPPSRANCQNSERMPLEANSLISNQASRVFQSASPADSWKAHRENMHASQRAPLESNSVVSYHASSLYHGTNPADNGKACRANFETSPKVSVEAYSSASNEASSLMIDCPRVFCLATSGYLLLSNIGHLGIVCSCHSFRMSAFKFCEHSGLYYGVNPGDVIRMDNGETIAQWCKLNLSKFGIRIPGEKSEWDWPQELSATASWMNHGVPIPKISNISTDLVFSGGGSVTCKESFDGVLSSKSPIACQSFVNSSVLYKPEGNSEDHHNPFLKALTGTSQSNLQMANKMTMQHAMKTSKLVGNRAEDGCQLISAYTGSPVTRSPSAHPSLLEQRNEKLIGKGSDFYRVEKTTDAAISNIELRLGQPYQLAQTSGNTDISGVGRPLLGTVVNPMKSLFPQQMNTSGVKPREEVEFMQCVRYSSKPPSNPSRNREWNRLNQDSNSFVTRNGTEDERAQYSVPFLTNLKSPSKESKPSTANNYMLNVSGNTMRNSVHCVPLPDENNVNSVWGRGGNSERQLDMLHLGSYKLIDSDKGLSFDADASHLAKCKEMEVSSSFNMLRANGNPNFSTTHRNSCYSYQLCGTSDSQISPYYPEKVISFAGSGQVDHVYLRPVSSSMGSEIPTHAVSNGIPVSASTSPTYPVAPFCSQEFVGVHTHLRDDILQVHSTRQVQEISKLTSPSKKQVEGRFGFSSYMQQSHIDTSSSGKQSHKLILGKKHDFSEAGSHPSDVTCRIETDEDTASPACVNCCCQFSQHKQGNALNCNQVSLNHQTSVVPCCPKQPSPSEKTKDVPKPSKHERCCQKVACGNFHGSSSHATYRNCIEINSESRVGSCRTVSKVQKGSVNSEASVILSPQFADSHLFPNDKNVSLDHTRKLTGEVPKNKAYHNSEWRNVPSKARGVSDVKRVDRLANLFDATKEDREKLEDTCMKCLNGTVQITDSLKEHGASNISSGCYARVISQPSVEFSNMESSTNDSGDHGCGSNFVVDLGSSIDKTWSSDDAPESKKSAKLLASTGFSLKKVEPPNNLHHESSSCLDDIKLLNSLTWQKSRDQIPAGFNLRDKDKHLQNIKQGLKIGKRKGELGLKLNASCSNSSASPVRQENQKSDRSSQFTSQLSKSLMMLSTSRKSGTDVIGNCITQSSSKPRLHVLSSAKKLLHRSDLHKLHAYRESEVSSVFQKKLNVSTTNHELPEISGGKTSKRNFSSNAFRKFQIQESGRENAKRTKINSVDGFKSTSSEQVNIGHRRSKPIVCGIYGELTDGSLTGRISKPAKLVPLSRVLCSSPSCIVPKHCKSKSSSMIKRKLDVAVICDRYEMKTEKYKNCHYAKNEDTWNRKRKECSIGERGILKEPASLEKQREFQSEKDHQKIDDIYHTQLQMKPKEIRKRSIYEFTGKGEHLGSEKSSVSKISNFRPVKEGKPVATGEGDSAFCQNSAKISTQEHKCHNSCDSAPVCCVCGSSNQDEINNLLECYQCSIRVHQACYGVSKVPKDSWSCRPCRTSSKDIVCVLCGYGGGAMTRALRSQTIVVSLLRAWNVEIGSGPKNELFSGKTLQKESTGLQCSSYRHSASSSHSVSQPESGQPLASAHCKSGMPDGVENFPSFSKTTVHNSITVGLVDVATKQWLHMVCGLWTSETRCPNVHTMSAFDVSGVPLPSDDVVCCMCKRAGGSCIQCRVENCYVRFHPWCAHLKGLLQTEVEGVDNENVGFYGRCEHHATHPIYKSDYTLNTEDGCLDEKKLSCARTEGYKGRKRDGFRHNYCDRIKGSDGCVPQEQLNAWAYINGQKPCTQEFPKLAISEIEHDTRKEYIRYKQAKLWKHLVVYKSGIHALGLYTSRFISRDEMVVEYVGEIVGQRLSDKRENEYQSAKKLQYKSACYFFRISKEHIIDATCKGGIGRFVNHSCSPNCVAKVISVRNEKKVVFLAERDIFPGEEITYDYHFNHEDEGKKIPCYCNSKNCRRYLN